MSGNRIKRTGSRVIGKDELESTEKEGRMCVLAVKMCVLVCGVGNWLLMVVV